VKPPNKTSGQIYDIYPLARVPNLELWYHFNYHAPRPGPVEWQPPRAYRPRSLYTCKT